MKRKYKIQFYDSSCNAPIGRLLRRTLQRFVNNWAKTNAVWFCAFFFLFTFFSSCTKVIHVPLKEADKQLVIEGIVPYGYDTFPEVRISETKSFEDDNSFVGVSGATVTIKANNQMVYSFTENSAGFIRLLKTLVFQAKRINLP